MIYFLNNQPTVTVVNLIV